MQKTFAREHAKNKPSKPKSKPKTQSWRKKVDWSAAGHKAYATRMKNLKKNRKTSEIKRFHRNAEAPQQKIRK